MQETNKNTINSISGYTCSQFGLYWRTGNGKKWINLGSIQELTLTRLDIRLWKVRERERDIKDNFLIFNLCNFLTLCTVVPVTKKQTEENSTITREGIVIPIEIILK